MLNCIKKINRAVILALFIFCVSCAPAELPPAETVPVTEIPAQTPEITATPVITPSPTQDAAPTPTPAPTPVPQAKDITDTLTVVLPDDASSAKLLDRDYNTKNTFVGDVNISVSSDEEIHSLYMIWDEPPGIWTITHADTARKIGFDGIIIHEYVELACGERELTLTLPSDGAVLCDIYAFTEGTPPGWVQVWKPPLEKADLLLIPTHADDEHLFFIGVMPYYAGERGMDVQVAYMTNHWYEQPRPHEVLNGLWTVGITNYPYISHMRNRQCHTYEDALNRYGYENIVNFHIELLRRFKPSVVVGHDINGEYGHGAHMLNARALIAAVERAGSEDYHEQSLALYGTWDTPKLYLNLYKDNRITMDWDIPLESFDGMTARDMAIRGYDHHISQHQWSFSVPRAGSGRISGSVFGLVRSTVGPDVIGGDMFENIDG